MNKISSRLAVEYQATRDLRQRVHGSKKGNPDPARSDPYPEPARVTRTRGHH